MSANRPLAGVPEIASLIDHTLLKPDATKENIVAACEQAIESEFASVCVNPVWVPLVQSELSHSKVKTCTVVGFPLGATRTKVKVEETRLATSDGATEVDMVINIGALRTGNLKLVSEEIEQIALAAHTSGAILKVILETCLLTDKQKVLACVLAKEAGADFVKTSTGFSTGGAKEADVVLMRSTVGPVMGVKASGGVRTLEVFNRMVQAGANRIGSSSGVQIIAEFLAGVPSPDLQAGSY